MKTEILAKQFLVEMGRRVGLDWKTFDHVKEYEQTCGKEWFWSQSWTQEEEDEFRDWMTGELKRKSNLGEKTIKREVNAFILNWGWRISER